MRPRQIVAIARLRRAGLPIAWDVRYSATPATRFTFGPGCNISPGSIVVADSGELVLGAEIQVGNYCNIRAGDSRIEIGDRTLLAQFVSLIATNHALDEHGVPDRHKIAEPHGITIGADCWLGVQSVVMPGVTLGDRCVVGAGAVVTHSFPAGSIIGGVPARLLR